LWVPIIHPCWSGSILVLVEDAAEPVLSTDVEVRDLLRVGYRFGERAASCCRSCADERSPDGPPAQSAMNVLMSFAFVAAFEPEVGIAPGRHRTLRTE
jgi:hypothetical protein